MGSGEILARNLSGLLAFRQHTFIAITSGWPFRQAKALIILAESRIKIIGAPPLQNLLLEALEGGFIDFLKG